MCLDSNHARLAVLRGAVVGGLFALAAAESGWAAPAPGLIDARDAADVGRLALADPADAADTLRAAEALGLGDPAAVIFATLTPASSPEDAAALTAAAAGAAPGSADLFVAAALAASAATPPLREAVLRAAIAAVEASALTAEARSAEIVEILAALSALVDPEELPRLAALVAAITAAEDDAGVLLAALDGDIQTGALGRRPFETGTPAPSRAPFPLALPPQAEDRDAPSGN